MGTRFLRPLLLAVGSAAIPLACSRTDPAPGELMLAVQTDMHAPKDVDAVGIYVAERDPITQHDTLIFGFAEKVAPDGTVHFPATLAVVGKKNPGATVRVRAVAFQKTKATIVRDAITTIPTDRAALLRLPLRWIDDNGKTQGSFGSGSIGSASFSPGVDAVLRPQAGDTSLLDGFQQIISGCRDDQTPQNGGCAPAAIDSSSLPDYNDALVFGGGTPDGGGACFDAAKCFAGAHKLDLDLATCSAPAPPGVFDLAIVTSLASNGLGDCDPSGCYVPLEKDESEGWTVQNGRVVLPGAYCDRIKSGDALGIVDDTSVPGCAPKANDAPLCGPASAVGTGVGLEGDGGPIVDGGGDGTNDGGDASTWGLEGIPPALALTRDANDLYAVLRAGRVVKIPFATGVATTLADLGGVDAGTDAGLSSISSGLQLALVGTNLVVLDPGTRIFYLVPLAGGPVATDSTSQLGGPATFISPTNNAGELAYYDPTQSLIRNCNPGVPTACNNNQNYIGTLPSGIGPSPSAMLLDTKSGLVTMVGSSQKNTDIEVWKQANPFTTAASGAAHSPAPTSGALTFDGSNVYYTRAEAAPTGNIYFATKLTGSTAQPYLTTGVDFSTPAGEPHRGLSLDPSGAYLFWTTSSGIFYDKLGQRSPQLLLSEPNARQIVVDADYVYYAVLGPPGAIRRVAWKTLP